MNNKEIAGKLKKAIKLMELNGENDFKVRTYQNAVQRIERHEGSLALLRTEDLTKIDGIGNSIAETITEICNSGSFELMRDLEDKTPQGLIELMQFRGIGTKKLRTLWQEFNITDKHELKTLIESGKLLSVKGFGAKTVANLDEVVDYAIECEGLIYFAEAEKIGNELINSLKKLIPKAQLSQVGKLRRKWEVIKSIEILIDQPLPKLIPILEGIDFIKQDKKKSGPFSWKGTTTISPEVEIAVYPTSSEKFIKELILKTGSQEHLSSSIGDHSFHDHVKSKNWETEEACYTAAGLEFCEPEIREGDWEFGLAKAANLPELIELKDLKGILHNHTRYSDGQNSLTEMAEACRELGYEYVGITDHSKAASFYANGLFEERVLQQQMEIDSLNKKMGPFKIFKGIEADILADGALDYDEETLKSFDFVVASIHSGLSMDKTKATERLITAIANPYTTILGHMTGRILLQRVGYPVDHEAIINACAEFGVIIEINSHPKRLDIDWRWVHKALDKGLTLSINPDAHEIAGYEDMYYGVCVGRKGGLTKKQTLNSWPMEEVDKYFEDRKKKILSR